jgi:hypothetical protein
MTTRILYLSLIGGLIVGHSLHAMVFDNRFFPLIQLPYITNPDHMSHAKIDAFATTGSQAVDNRQSDIEIPEIFGPFDLAVLGQSMIENGYFVPLRPAWLAAELPWTVKGKIQTQGISLFVQQQIYKWFSVGFWWAFMRLESSQQFYFNAREATVILGPGEVLEIDRARREMFQELNLACNHYTANGSGDIDAFIRAENRWDRPYKFRTIILGGKLGALLPTGKRRNIDNPASVPFGGNGHWGVYGSIDSEFEVREDWKIGILGRVSKRFARTDCQRMPVCNSCIRNQGTDQERVLNESEPQIFGAIVGQAKVTPGFTGIFSPYFQAENIRDGFGLRAQYNLIAHQQDSWEDMRADQCPAVNIQKLEEDSDWASEYLILSAFYDFNKMRHEKPVQSIVTLNWEIPASFLVSHGFVKSFKVSLGVELNW